MGYLPPQNVQNAARRGLEYRRKYKRGGLSSQEAGKQGIGSGVQRAINLMNGDEISLNTIKMMRNFFSRHKKNYRPGQKEGDGGPTAGTIAWLLWGGEPGRVWVNRVLAKETVKHVKHNQLSHGHRYAQTANSIRASVGKRADEEWSPDKSWFLGGKRYHRNKKIREALAKRKRVKKPEKKEEPKKPPTKKPVKEDKFPELKGVEATIDKKVVPKSGDKRIATLNYARGIIALLTGKGSKVNSIVDLNNKAESEGLKTSDLVAISRAIHIDDKYKLPMYRTKAYKGNTGVILSLDPSQDQAKALQLGVNGAVDWRDMHMTLIYLGRAEDLEPYKARVLRVAQVLANHCQPIQAKTNGMATFNKQNTDGTYPSVALMDSPQFPKLRVKAEALLNAMGIPYHVEHGFIPHITLAYTPLSSLPRKLPPDINMDFDSIRLHWGDDVVSFPMGGDHKVTGEHHDHPHYTTKHAKHDQRTHGYRFGKNAPLSYVRGMQKRHGEGFRKGYMRAARDKKGDQRISRARTVYQMQDIAKKRLSDIKKEKSPQKRLDMVNKLQDELNKSKYAHSTTFQMPMAKIRMRAKLELKKQQASQPSKQLSKVLEVKESSEKPKKGTVGIADAYNNKFGKPRIIDNVKAEIYGNYAVHGKGNNYSVTHIPSGFSIMPHSLRMGKGDAQKWARMLHGTLGERNYHTGLNDGGKFDHKKDVNPYFSHAMSSARAKFNGWDAPDISFFVENTYPPVYQEKNHRAIKATTLYKVPKPIKNAAIQGLSLRRMLGESDYFASMQMAHKLITGEVSFDCLSQMWDYWNNQSDHYKNEASDMMFGGPAGMAWVNGMMKRREKPEYA